MGLLSMGSDERETLIRSVALLAAVFSQGTITGHPVQDTESRAQKFESYLRGEEERD